MNCVSLFLSEDINKKKLLGIVLAQLVVLFVLFLFPPPSPVLSNTINKTGQAEPFAK